MTLTIELAPELEDRLREEATRRGLDAVELARRLIEERLPAPTSSPQPPTLRLTPEEWIREFDAYCASHDPTKPPLPPEAFERESFYGDRG